MARKGVAESGNVALEMILAVSLSVTLLFPVIEVASQVYRSKTELNETFLVLGRIFQKSPTESLRKNISEAQILLQRQSDRKLRVNLSYLSNSEGNTNRLSIKASIATNVPIWGRIEEVREVSRADYVP